MLNNLLTALNDCVWAFDVITQKYLFISPSIHAITSYDLKDFQQNIELWNEIIDPDDRDEVLAEAPKYDSDEWVEFMYRIITKRGKTKWVQQKKRYLIDEQTNHPIELSVIIDISDQKQNIEIEKEIKRTSEKLNNFIESITDSFFIINNDWKFIKINSAFEKITSKSRDEIIGSAMWDICPYIMATKFEEAYRKAMARQITVQVTEYLKPLNKWFNIIVYPSSEGLTVFIRDITYEKSTQEEIVWTKNNLEALINNTEDMTWSIDKEGRYVYMNRAYQKRIEDTVGVIPKDGDDAYMHSGPAEKINKEWKLYYQRAFGGERYNTRHKSFNPKTKEFSYFEVSFNPIYRTTKDEIIGVGCFARDITDRLKNEEALIEQNERLKNIASLSSHELRRPVASMIGLLNILDRENFSNPENKQIIDHLFTVTQEIDEVIRLIVNKTFIDTRFPL